MATTGTRNESRDNGTLGAVRFITSVPVKYLTEPQISIILTDGHGREVKFLGVDGASSRTSSSLYLYKCSDAHATVAAYHPIQLAQSLSGAINLANRNGDLAIISWMEGSCAVLQQVFEDYDSNGLGSVSIGGTGQDNGDMIFYDFKKYRGRVISAVATALKTSSATASNYDEVTLTISDGANTIVYEFDSNDTYGATGTLNGSNVIVQLPGSGSNLMNVANELKSAIESSNGHGGKYGTIHVIIGDAGGAWRGIMDFVHTAPGTTSPSSTTGGGTIGNTTITCSTQWRFSGWQPRDDFAWDNNDKTADISDSTKTGFSFSGGVNSSKRGADDLYIKPKIVVEPDFALHHYDIDHVSSNYISTEDLRHSLFFAGEQYVHIEVDDRLDLHFYPAMSSRSWSIWFKMAPDLAIGTSTLFSHQSGNAQSSMALTVNTTSNAIAVSSGDWSGQTGNNRIVADNRWHHAVVILNPAPFGVYTASIALYIDGELQTETGSSVASTGEIPYHWGSLELGTLSSATPPGSYLPYIGFLSDFSHWETTLTASEVVELYNGGKPLDLTTHSAAASLALWWKLASGDTAGSEVDLKDYANGAIQIASFIGTGINVGATPHVEANTSGGPDHKLQAPFSKRFQLIRGAGSGRTTIG